MRTVFALGILNVFRVLHHKLRVKFYLKSIRPGHVGGIAGPFFLEDNVQVTSFIPSDHWKNTALYFGWWPYHVGVAPPNWHLNPVHGKETTSEKCWTELSDFNAETGDIKLIWEASRFSWVLAFVERYLAGDESAFQQLNRWLADWLDKNPPFQGVNWKCGQEAGVRVLHLAMASVLLRQETRTTSTLCDMIKLHIIRIEQTLQYALSQNNNHGTSEAAALFIGGSWLKINGVTEGLRWERLGRKWLEKLVGRLVEKDGSFSQYSTNYHRVLLDTLSMVEIWRSHVKLAPFSSNYIRKVKAAVAWLGNMVDATTGDVPVIGANDGAYLFPVGRIEYRDFRLTVQTAAVLFYHKVAYEGKGDFNRRIALFKIPQPKDMIHFKQSKLYDQGGYAVLQQQDVMVVLRYPRFHYRPSQADILHVDCWVTGLNVLRDAGTYSYHGTPEENAYFPGTQSHNTIQFDERDQMPRLSRFLFGDWLNTDHVEPISTSGDEISVAAAYRDRHGVYHKRTIVLSSLKLKVIDDIDGFKKKAVLRWRLEQADWVLNAEQMVSAKGRLSIFSSVPIIEMTLVDGWESRYYMQKTQSPVVEVVVHQPGQMITEYEWKK